VASFEAGKDQALLDLRASGYVCSQDAYLVSEPRTNPHDRGFAAEVTWSTTREV